MNRPLLTLLALLAAAPAPLLAAAAPPPPPAACPVPDEALPPAPHLPHTVRALRRHQPLRIVAIGAGATAGSGLTLDQAFPARLAARLAAAYPGSAVTLLNKGRLGESTATMADTLRSQVLPEHPTLVLWEAGTVESVTGADPQQMAEDMLKGLDRLRAAQADVILIDMQYSPAAAAVIDFSPYLEALHIVAESAEVPMFDRFAAMRAWTEENQIDLDAASGDHHRAQAARAEDCVAAGLAALITRATQMPSPDHKP
ncbi:hypothetical protein GALL_175520 [mine drainage metagenome]|uniref:SGNH hydrolase-type esterase domain-containing protein n=1 Tax=mine drainage metagenome TaxID=410659 RepID=A0A1J5SF10_9ZZZZ